MVKENRKIISELRKDSRQRISQIASKLGMPVSTVFERIKSIEKSLVKKYTAVLDYERLGFPIQTHILLSPGQAPKEVLGFLKECFHTNNLLRIDNDYEFFVELFFRNISEVDNFCERMKDLGVDNLRVFYVTNTIKHEGFVPG